MFVLDLHNVRVMFVCMNVTFYKTEAGSVPVIEYLRPLAEKQRKMVGGVIRAIQDKDAIPASAKAVTNRYPLCELSIGFHRIFYVVKGSTMILLHAYQKDSQKAPLDEMKIAEGRMKKALAK